MPKSTPKSSKKVNSVKPNQKISAYFHRIDKNAPKPSEPAAHITDNEDCKHIVINLSPTTKPSVLESPINTSRPTRLTPENKKRKHSQTSTPPSPDVIPCSPHTKEQQPPKIKKHIRKLLSRKKLVCELDDSYDLPQGSNETEKINEETVTKCKLDDSWDVEFNVVENEPSGLDLTESQHCKVVDVQRWRTELKLLLQSTADAKSSALCEIRGFWSQMEVAVDDVLHVSAVYDKAKSVWIVDNNCGSIVYEPDFLVSATSVMGSLFCKRRSVLKERYRGFETSNRAMIVGILVHKLFQDALRRGSNDVSTAKIEADIRKMLSDKDTIMRCYESSLPIEDLRRELGQFVPRIVDFTKKYRKKNGYKPNEDEWKGSVAEIEDIEENIWCPQLGMKGKVDVSVRNDEAAVMPLELKTGRATVSLEHRGQIMFYVMMMNKCGYNVDSGLLLYLREGVLREIKVTDKEKRDLIILRNEFARNLLKKPTIDGSNRVSPPELPEPINHCSACSKCPYNTICSAYLAHEKFDLSNNNALRTISKELLSHLSVAHLNYFIEWSSLLELEASCNHGSKELHEIYTVPPEKRQKNGQCIINVRLTGDVTSNGDVFEHSFEKHRLETTNFSESGINMGDYIVVSLDGRPAIAAGFVLNVDYQIITVNLDRDLSKRYTKRTFHLDTYNSTTFQTFNMTSLSLILEPNEHSEKLRRFVVDKKPPSFMGKLPKAIVTEGVPILRSLNEMQRKAVLKAFTADDYLLIKGMPGTGKTATIVALVRLLVQRKRSVLITSHTHSAVDNVCVRLLDCGDVKLLRLGADGKIDPKLHDSSEAAATRHCNTPEELAQVYDEASVVAVTCMGSGHPVLSKRRFDVCIVDESTQVIQCAVFRVLHCADKFVLIGDPEQLPPIVKNREAKARGLSESLFERLDVPEATVTLKLNYRMNETITAMANALTYQNQLLIANESVAKATLKLPNGKVFLETYKDQAWILQVLDESLSSAVKILDTGPVWKHSPQNTNSNRYETAIVKVLVEALLEEGVCSETIGVIAPYRAQVIELSKVLGSRNIEVSTVDRFQGRDKDVVVYSCTKSSELTGDVSEHEILEDKRRLTVAITRAKKKFVMVGDLSTIKRYKPFAKLLRSLGEECFVNFDETNLNMIMNGLD